MKKIEIGRLVTLKQGFAINKKTKHHISDQPTELHLLRIGDMKDGVFSIYVKDSIPNSFIAKQSDIIYTRTGQVGLVFRNQEGVVHNNCFTVNSNDESVLNQNYLYYALQEKSFYNEAIRKATGAAQPDLPHNAFKSIKIFLPSIESQKRITNVLSAYDDLIENNKKQIKLLEEAAQRLYKEWFVDLRFPGREQTRIVEGVPLWWKRCQLKDIGTFARGKTITSADVRTGNVPVVAGGMEPAYYHNKSNTIAPVVTVSGSGANAGFTNIYYENVWASDCSFLDVKSTKYPYFVFCFLKSNKGIMVNLQKGSAQPHVYAKDLNNVPLMLPDKELLDKFEKTVSPMFEKIKCSLAENKYFKEARDRLLPKLLSGEIEVQ